MKNLLSTIFAVTLLALVSPAHALVMLSLEPTPQTAMSGDSVSLDLVISGLTDGGPDSLGDFDIDIGYDRAALSLTSFALGSFLGEIGLFEASDFSLGDLGVGIINVSELSLLEPESSCFFCIEPYLDDIQPDSFSLATFDFMVDVLAVGSSTTVSIDTVWALGDGFGDPLDLMSTTDAVIRNPSTAVPVPATLALFGIGLAGLGWSRRKQTS